MQVLIVAHVTVGGLELNVALMVSGEVIWHIAPNVGKHNLIGIPETQNYSLHAYKSTEHEDQQLVNARTA